MSTGGPAPDRLAPVTGLPDRGAAVFRSRFLGLDELPGFVVLTPVGFLARRLTQDVPPRPGIWPTWLVDGVPVVMGPQGRPVIDGVLAVPPGSAVIFVGLAGGLTVRSAIGQVVWVERAWDGRSWHRASLPPPAGLQSVRAATVGSLTESWHRTESLREVADVVDLETSHVLEAAAARGVSAASLLLVSDSPPARPFWDTDLSSLASGADALASVLRSWLRDHAGQ